MKNNLFIFVYIFVNILLKTISTEPEFCSTLHFDAVFHYGYKLIVKSNEWIWTHNKETNLMEGPENWHKDIKTSIFVTQTPVCDKSPDYCELMSKAKELLFLRHSDPNNTGHEITTVMKYYTNGTVIKVKPKDFPWNLTSNANIWPEEWDYLANTPRPGVFVKGTFECIFIAFSGNKDESKLLINNISSIDWYKTLKSYPLHSNVNYIGMFTNDNRVYAVGDTPEDTKRESKVFELKSPNGMRSVGLEFTNYSLRKFFGCVIKDEVLDTITNTPVVTTINTIEQGSDGKKPVEESESDEGNNHSLLIIVVAIVFILLISVFVIIFIYIRTKGNGSEEVESNVPKDENPNRDETATRVSSIETIDSNTGQRVLDKP